MLSAVSSVAGRLYGALPAIKLDSPKNMLNKATLIAIPAMMLYGSTVTQGVDAFLSCVVCVTCLAAANPGCILPCVICGLLLPAPIHVAEPGNSVDQCYQKC